ncbi:MAG: hypothetical protein RUDDFDWM_000171 [Candidatus Fervidibacterota bacterium]
MISFVLCAFVLLVALTEAHTADYVVHAVVTRGGKEEKPTNEVTYFKNEKLRYELGNIVIIADTKRNEVMLISNSRREYTVVKIERLQQLADGWRKKLEEQLKALEEQMKEAKPEEKQKMMQVLMMLSFLNQRFKSVSVEEGGVDKIAGYRSKRFCVHGDGKLVAELWFCDALKIGVDVNKLIDIVFSITPTPLMVRQVYEAVVKKASGLPMRQELYVPMRMSRRVTKVEKRTLPGSLFEPPKGFTKVDFEKLIQSAIVK